MYSCCIPYAQHVYGVYLGALTENIDENGAHCAAWHRWEFSVQNDNGTLFSLFSAEKGTNQWITIKACTNILI